MANWMADQLAAVRDAQNDLVAAETGAKMAAAAVEQAEMRAKAAEVRLKLHEDWAHVTRQTAKKQAAEARETLQAALKMQKMGPDPTGMLREAATREVKTAKNMTAKALYHKGKSTEAAAKAQTRAESANRRAKQATTAAAAAAAAARAAGAHPFTNALVLNARAESSAETLASTGGLGPLAKEKQQAAIQARELSKQASAEAEALVYAAACWLQAHEEAAAAEATTVEEAAHASEWEKAWQTELGARAEVTKAAAAAGHSASIASDAREKAKRAQLRAVDADSHVEEIAALPLGATQVVIRPQTAMEHLGSIAGVIIFATIIIIWHNRRSKKKREKHADECKNDHSRLANRQKLRSMGEGPAPKFKAAGMVALMNNKASKALVPPIAGMTEPLLDRDDDLQPDEDDDGPIPSSVGRP